jgi:hypothetical protein
MVRRASGSCSDKMSAKTSNRNKYLHYFNIRSTWWNDDGLAYEPDSEKIEKLKNSLHNQYPVDSGCLEKIIELFYSK